MLRKWAYGKVHREGIFHAHVLYYESEIFDWGGGGGSAEKS